MTIAEYEQLGRMEKLAVFLIVVGEEAAAQVLKEFDEEASREVCTAIAKVQAVDTPVQERVLEEFTELIGAGAGMRLGGQSFARGALGQAVGEGQARRLLDGVLPEPQGAQGPWMQELLEMQDRELFNVLEDEAPQTTAFVLGQLGPERMYRVLGLFESERRGDIIECMAEMQPTSPRLLERTVQALKRKISLHKQQRLHESGGVETVASLLNLMDKEESKSLLARMEKGHEELAKIIRKKMFGFEDLLKLEAPDMQKVLQEVETNDLAFALKISSEPLKEAVFGAMSKRAAEGLRYEIKMLGGVKKADVLAAQDKVVEAVRRLEEDGAISLEGSGETIE